LREVEGKYGNPDQQSSSLYNPLYVVEIFCISTTFKNYNRDAAEMTLKFVYKFLHKNLKSIPHNKQYFQISSYVMLSIKAC